MHLRRLGWTLILGAVCAASPAWPQPHDETAPPSTPFKAVLIAGDGSLAVFDHAVSELAGRLGAAGTPPADIQRLTGSRRVMAQLHARSATLDHVLAAVGAMRPGPGQGCLVFATSHGVEHYGFYLAQNDEVLTPEALDRALQRGCGTAPTAVVISSCYSGGFARPPMTRANRVVLTAARPDRTSFGCRVGRDYTVYDKCLLDAFARGGTWRHAYVTTKACVTAAEVYANVTPSEPQAWFGEDAAALPLPASTVPALPVPALPRSVLPTAE